jgi:multisubunit Na+/H+ antiporter MnhG subunit
MSRPASNELARTLKLYAAGHATLLLGAAAMHVTGSMLPLALAASACLMLTAPLVRQVMARAAARRG